MEELIRHEGIVLSVKGCKARSMCMSSESQAKEMDAMMTEPMQAGDRVEVEVREHLAWRAVLLAYILPFIVMMMVIAGLDYFTQWSEAIVGTLSLCSIALYYLILNAFRSKLQKQFTFTARKI